MPRSAIAKSVYLHRDRAEKKSVMAYVRYVSRRGVSRVFEVQRSLLAWANEQFGLLEGKLVVKLAFCYFLRAISEKEPVSAERFADSWERAHVQLFFPGRDPELNLERRVDMDRPEIDKVLKALSAHFGKDDSLVVIMHMDNYCKDIERFDLDVVWKQQLCHRTFEDVDDGSSDKEDETEDEEDESDGSGSE